MDASRWGASHLSDAANAISIPPGEYGRKAKTQRITGDLVKEGLLDKFGEGEKSVYYFAPEKKLAKLREGEY